MSSLLATRDARQPWQRALHLRERLEYVSERREPPDAGYRYGGLDLGLWSGSTYRHRLTLSERLRLEGIDAAAFERVLTTSPETLSDVDVPWSATLRRLLQPRSTQDAGETRGVPRLITAFVEPAIADAVSEAKGRIASQPPGSIDTSAVPRLLATQLVSLLVQQVLRTLVLEMHVARLRGRLAGATPEARFESYAALCETAGYRRELLEEYPVLGRDIDRCVRRWIENVVEFAGRLQADASDIRRLTERAAGAPLEIEQLQPNAGDAHRGGRTVILVTFRGGDMVVYKPRPLGIEARFATLVASLNEECGEELWRTVVVADRGEYGWNAGVRRAPCESKEAVRRFYRRQGAALALFYALDATDMHLENVIAAGEFPVWVDLEALFQPELRPDEDATPTKPLGLSMTGSVLRVGLLPHRVWTPGQREPLDVSGLGGAPGQQTPNRILRVDAEGTDEMRYVREHIGIPGAQNRPTLDGEDVEPSAFVDAILDGFETGYRTIMRARGRLLAPTGLAAQFSDVQVRVIFRATRNYGVLLQEATHPDVIRDALGRDELLDHLWTGYLPVHVLNQIVPFEQQELLAGDVPIFHTSPTTTDVCTSAGHTLSGLLLRPALDKVLDRLRLFSETDLAQQIWYIRAAFATTTRSWSWASPTQGRYYKASLEGQRATALGLAAATGDRLAALAHLDGGDVHWTGVSLIENRHWQLLPSGPSLYDGLAGIALFLGYLAECAPTTARRELAEATIDTADRTLQMHLNGLHRGAPSVGGFSGIGGLVYALAHVGSLWGSSKHLSRASHWAAAADQALHADVEYDVISGAAGLLLAVLALHRATGDPALLELAGRCGAHLRTHARTMPTGVAWPTSVPSQGPLGGFAHGCAGIAFALDRLDRVTGRDDHRDLADAARRYEDSLFDAAECNWRDLRTFDEPLAPGAPTPASLAAWCHGAPGIGLGRIGSRANGACVPSESIVRSIGGTVVRGFGANHSLCHGDLGNLELLRMAMTERELSAGLGPVVDALQRSILAQIDEFGPQCGIPLAVETPGLMTGLAGVGYGLLRISAPEVVPSVLTMEPPRSRR